MKIIPATFAEVFPLKKQAESDGIIFCKSTIYLIAVDEDGMSVAGFCGYYQRGSKMVFKNVYVRPHYRRRGIAAMMLHHRLGLARNLKVQFVEANCTEASLHLYMENGAVVTKKFKNGITTVRITL
jgi:GNAT superfamily N-acetyltransferase